MMNGVQQYILSVVSTALICSIFMATVKNGAGGEVLRLLCGLFLGIAILLPISRLEIESLFEIPESIQSEGQTAMRAGEKMASNARKDIISARLQAYILDKASALNGNVEVEVVLGKDSLPEKAVITGDLTPYARTQMKTLLETELGIPKERQQWIG